MAAGVAGFTLAWLSGADLGPAGEVAEGASTRIGETLRFYSEWPEFRLVPTIGIMLVLNASRFGAVLVSARAGRWAPVRWLLLYLAATVVLTVPLVLDEIGHLEGWPIWAVWELETLVRLGATTRTLVVIPPVPQGERLQRWKAFKAVAAGAGLPTDYTPWRALVLTFDGKGGWELVTADRHDEYGYEVALEAGMASLRAPAAV